MRPRTRRRPGSARVRRGGGLVERPASRQTRSRTVRLNSDARGVGGRIRAPRSASRRPLAEQDEPAVEPDQLDHRAGDLLVELRGARRGPLDGDDRLEPARSCSGPGVPASWSSRGSRWRLIDEPLTGTATVSSASASPSSSTPERISISVWPTVSRTGNPTSQPSPTAINVPLAIWIGTFLLRFSRRTAGGRLRHPQVVGRHVVVLEFAPRVSPAWECGPRRGRGRNPKGPRNGRTATTLSCSTRRTEASPQPRPASGPRTPGRSSSSGGRRGDRSHSPILSLNDRPPCVKAGPAGTGPFRARLSSGGWRLSVRSPGVPSLFRPGLRRNVGHALACLHPWHARPCPT